MLIFPKKFGHYYLNIKLIYINEYLWIWILLYGTNNQTT